MKASWSISCVLGALALTLANLPATAQIGEGQFISRTIYHEGYMRHYFLYIPSAYDGSEEWPLVMSFHGFRWEAQGHALQDHMSLVADTAHFLVAYPQGLTVTIKFLGGIASGAGWDSDGSWVGRNDIQFASLIIDDIDADYSVDLSRVHAMGFSNGSVMSFGLACRLSDRIASIGGVSASMMDVDTYGGCVPERPVATLQMHGTSDSGILYGYGWDYSDLPVIETSRFWARENGCSTDWVMTDLPDIDDTDHSTVTIIEYPDCEADTEVLFYRINGAGHTWPGSSSGAFRNDFKNQDIDASVEIWNFFARHPHPNPATDYFYLRYQDQVEAFPDDLSQVPHYLWIGNSPDITDLTPLSAVKSIEGDLVVSTTQTLAGLDGLQSLETVGGELAIYNNTGLTNTYGLSSLVSVGEDLTIRANPALASLDGFPALSSVDGNLSVYQNSGLTYIHGLGSLRSVGEDLEVKYNPALSRLASLSSLEGVAGNFTIYDNDALLEVDSLSSLTSVGGHVRIDRNAVLSSLDGFSALTSVGGDLEIAWNDSLTDLNAFSNVSAIGGRLRIGVNPILTSCSCGLYSCVSSGCVQGVIAMTSNAESGDCNNNGADLVANACEVESSVEDVPSELPTRFTLYAAYPNPFNPTTTITYDLPVPAIVRQTVYDGLGRTVSELGTWHLAPGTYSEIFDATGLPSGLYFYRLEAAGFVATKSLVLSK